MDGKSPAEKAEMIARLNRSLVETEAAADKAVAAVSQLRARVAADEELSRSPGRPRVSESERHRSIGISMSPEAAEELRSRAKERGVSQGQFVAELMAILDSQVVNDPERPWRNRGLRAKAPVIATEDQRRLALELTRAAIGAWTEDERPADLAKGTVDLYMEILGIIYGNDIKG